MNNVSSTELNNLYKIKATNNGIFDNINIFLRYYYQTKSCQYVRRYLKKAIIVIP